MVAILFYIYCSKAESFILPSLIEVFLSLLSDICIFLSVIVPLTFLLAAQVFLGMSRSS